MVGDGSFGAGATKCAKEAKCGSYAWDSTGANTCWLKFGAPQGTLTSGRQSNLKQAHVLPDVDLHGTVSVGWYDLPTGLEEECRADCENDSTCVAYEISLLGFGNRMQCERFTSVTEEFRLDRGSNYYKAGYKGLATF